MELHFNWGAIVASTVVGIAVPAIWYAPKFFGPRWMALSGLKAEDTKGQGGTYVLAVLCSFLTAFAMAGFLNFTQSATWQQGSMAGLQFWLGFVFAQMLVDYRFSKKSWTLLWINSGQSAVVMTLMGGILAAWK